MPTLHRKMFHVPRLVLRYT